MDATMLARFSNSSVHAAEKRKPCFSRWKATAARIFRHCHSQEPMLYHSAVGCVPSILFSDLSCQRIASSRWLQHCQALALGGRRARHGWIPSMRRTFKLHPSNPNFSKKGFTHAPRAAAALMLRLTKCVFVAINSVCAELAGWLAGWLPGCAPTSQPLIKSCQIQEQLGFGALFSAFHRYHHRCLILVVSHLPPPSSPQIALSKAHSG